MHRHHLAVVVSCATVVLLGVSGCSGGTTDATPDTDSTPRVTSTASTPPSSTPSTSPTQTVDALPPASYDPAWPDSTATTPDGYLVDTCVPQSLWKNVISLTDSDGVHLSGLALGTGDKGVLLSHEQGYSICSFLPLARELADAGYQVVLPEYRNHGASESTADNDNIDRDGAAALAELHRRGAHKVFIGGASCGGTASAILASREPDLAGLLIMSSPAHCGPLDGVAAIRSVDVPTLMIVSPGDMDGAVQAQVQQLFDASPSTDKKLIINDSGFHGTDMFSRSTDGDELRQRVFDFITSTFD